MWYYFYMNKDVIYIEPEDDITDIITKIENSKEKIVALVPPKKAGVFRSAVNIKLMAEDSSATQEMELTDTYIKHLEETIKNNPSIWLWTHNRWKHKVEMPNE